jgi:Ala-tRNA(Pro) deacylase
LEGVKEVDMVAPKLKEYLDSKDIKYATIKHDLVYTSQQTAANAHIHGKELAKTVMVKIDGKMVMVVLPASFKVNLDRLIQFTGAGTAEIATESEFQNMFSECDIGAMPPFGNLYGMEVYVEEKLTQDEEIAFNAGTHMELIKMPYKDFERLVKPKVGRFTVSKVPAF